LEFVVNPTVLFGVVLLAAWAILWLGFHIVAGVIHLLAVVALVLIVWGLVKRGARAIDRSV
jgi:hypothetical protein